MVRSPRFEFKADNAEMIQQRITAYMLLFDVEPRVTVWGTILCTDGEHAFLNSDATVLGISGELACVDLGGEGEWMTMDITNNAKNATWALEGRHD